VKHFKAEFDATIGQRCIAFFGTFADHLRPSRSYRCVTVGAKF
jgi:hypothetical protein